MQQNIVAHFTFSTRSRAALYSAPPNEMQAFYPPLIKLFAGILKHMVLDFNDD